MSEEIAKITEGQLRMDACRFRSEETEKRVVNRCQCKGGPYTVESYSCKKRNIAHVQEQHCKECPFFKSR
jgi:DNA gyrase inhibitor GyrI